MERNIPGSGEQEKRSRHQINKALPMEVILWRDRAKIIRFKVVIRIQKIFQVVASSRKKKVSFLL